MLLMFEFSFEKLQRRLRQQTSEDKVQTNQCYVQGVRTYCKSMSCREKLFRKAKREQQNLAAETDAHFTFLSRVSPGENLVVDSGATNNMIRD